MLDSAMAISPLESGMRATLAHFQAEWTPVSRPESAPIFDSRAHSGAKPVSTFAECALAFSSRTPLLTPPAHHRRRRGARSPPACGLLRACARRLVLALRRGRGKLARRGWSARTGHRGGRGIGARRRGAFLAGGGRGGPVLLLLKLAQLGHVLLVLIEGFRKRVAAVAGGDEIDFLGARRVRRRLDRCAPGIGDRAGRRPGGRIGSG